MDDDELRRRMEQFLSQMEDVQSAIGVVTALCSSSAPMTQDADLRIAAVMAAVEGRGMDGMIRLIDGLGTLVYLAFKQAADVEGKDRDPMELIRERAAETARVIDDGRRDLRDRFGTE